MQKPKNKLALILKQNENETDENVSIDELKEQEAENNENIDEQENS